MNKNYEFELLEVDGNEAISKLLELREGFTDSGKYPFIIGNAEGFQLIDDDSFQIPTSAEVLEKAESIDAIEWFERERQDFDEDFEDFEDDFDEYMGDLKDSPKSESAFEDRLLGHKDILSGIPHKKAYLGISEIEEPWMLPAFVKYGGWNACPIPEVHCALMRYWQKKHGAEIFSMTSSVIECKVENPPTNEEDSTNLAWEQYLYCPDIVEQGTGTIERLTATIIDSDYWYFWWD